MSNKTENDTIYTFSEEHFLRLVDICGDIPLYDVGGRTVAATNTHRNEFSRQSDPADAVEVCRNAELVGLYYAPALLDAAKKQAGNSLREKVQSYVDIHHNARSILENIPIIGQRFVRKPSDKAGNFIACNLN